MWKSFICLTASFVLLIPLMASYMANFSFFSRYRSSSQVSNMSILGFIRLAAGLY